MAQKHLKELLKEDQEPFQLKDYIAHKKCQLLNKEKQQQLVVPKSKLHLKTPKKSPISNTTSIFCKNACFFSLQESPDIRKSPKLFDFPPSPKFHNNSNIIINNNKSPNRVFLHVPAKTAAILLEAAARIQKQRSKPKTQIVKNPGFGLFGSMLKRLSLRNKAQKLKPKTEDDEENLVLVNVEHEDETKVIISSSVSSSTSTSTSTSSSSSCCSCSNGRQSSLDLDNDDDDDEEDDEFEFTNVLRQDDYHHNNNNNNIDDSFRKMDNNYNINSNGDYYSPFCLSPLSPFRFALHSSPSPELRKFEDPALYEQESSVKFQEEEDEEDKEQNSPVSVLDPPFEDDYDGQEEDTFDVERSYAFVQRSQQELLHKLHRFEKLAELDPIELEKKMIEDEEEEYILEHAREFERTLMQQVIRKTGLQEVKKPGVKRLISDLIIEEDCVENTSEEQVIKRVCSRLESWKEVESNTIDMMVGMDLRKEVSDWNKAKKEFDETTMDIEVAIFAVLVDELVEDLA